MRRLTEDEFKATAVPKKERVGLDEEPPFETTDVYCNDSEHYAVLITVTMGP